MAGVLAEAPGRFVLCGYSLGGRIALHVALAAPQRVTALVLIACSAGIEDEAERAERRRSDGALVKQLRSAPFEQFIERWQTVKLPSPLTEKPDPVTTYIPSPKR